MHKLERYGVVALVFLLVTILAVSLWSGGDTPDEVVARATPAAQEAGRGPTTGSARPVDRNQPPLYRPNSAAPGSSGQARPTGPEAPARRNQGPATRRTPQRPPSTREQAEQLLAEARGHGGATAATAGRPSGPAAPAARTSTERAGSRAGGEGLATIVQPPATRTASRPEPQPASGRTVVVRAGDTLSEIAERELGASSRWTEIVAANPGLRPERLLVGAKLRLPGGGAAPSAPRPAETQRAPAASADGVYVVRAGDTLSRIAARELGSADRWRQIAAANPNVDPNRLLVGARLRLPGATASPAEVRTPDGGRGWTNVARWTGSKKTSGQVR